MEYKTLRQINYGDIVNDFTTQKKARLQALNILDRDIVNNIQDYSMCFVFEEI